MHCCHFIHVFALAAVGVGGVRVATGSDNENSIEEAQIQNVWTQPVPLVRKVRRQIDTEMDKNKDKDKTKEKGKEKETKGNGAQDLEHSNEADQGQASMQHPGVQGVQ